MHESNQLLKYSCLYHFSLSNVAEIVSDVVITECSKHSTNTSHCSTKRSSATVPGPGIKDPIAAPDAAAVAIAAPMPTVTPLATMAPTALLNALVNELVLNLCWNGPQLLGWITKKMAVPP